MKIKYLRIEITPHETTIGNGRAYKDILVTLEVSGQKKLAYRKIIPDNDFESMFEHLMEHTKEAIKQELTKLTGNISESE